MYRLGLTAGVLGATLMIALPWLAVWAPGLPQPLLDAFAFDPRFLHERAVWVLPLWAAGFAVQTAVLLAGRWDRRTRLISLAGDLAWLVLLTWWLAAGRIFAADGAAKFGLLLVVVFVIIDIVVTVRRTSASIRPPMVQV